MCNARATEQQCDFEENKIESFAQPDNFEKSDSFFKILKSWLLPCSLRSHRYWVTYYPHQVSICNLEKMSGLGNITKIPSSGFSAPAKTNSAIACEVGYGYVIKFSDIHYVRIYVAESIVSTSGGIIGAKVKYQSPFVP